MDQDDSPSCVWLRSNGVKFTEDGMTLEYTGMFRNDVITWCVGGTGVWCVG